MDSTGSERSGIQLRIPLAPDFRFVHEPIHALTRERFVGRTSEVNELVQRLQFSNGGSFLITGYRGVGKTSFVNQVLHTLEQRVRLLSVEINLARPLTPAELMHLVIRRLYDRLIEKRWYEMLPPELQMQLTLAYQRTSANVVRKLAQSWESSLGVGDLKVPFRMPLSPKLDWKRSRSVDVQTSFVAYGR